MECKASLAAVGAGGIALKESIRDQKSEGLEKVRKGIEGGDLPEGFLHPGKSRTAKKSGRKTVEKWSVVPHHARYYYLAKYTKKFGSKEEKFVIKKSMTPTQTRRYAELQKQLAAIGPMSQGSVAFQAPKSWRWTFKLKGKTACVALSEEQAKRMGEAIENHKRLEEIVRKMREITQTQILESVLGVTRRKPLSEIPKAG
jgi:hypothetical protein